MARIVPTTDQKEGFLVSAEFKKQVKWAILNKAAYWSGLNGVGLADAASAKRWHLNRQFIATNNMLTLAEDFAIVKAFAELYVKNIQCVNSPGQYDEAETIQYLLGNNGAPINFFDQMADNWFDAQIANLNF